MKFKLDGVGGPSAGLMFTLAIYDQVSGQDLKAGRKIAGTGTIEKDGSVGDIGGAYLKVKSAADSGADIFFVPNNPVTKEMKRLIRMPRLTIKRPRKLLRNWEPR